MKFYLGVTDNNWFDFLKAHQPEDVNFWQPGGKTSFKVLEFGAPFLFKLKRPYNAIGGLGFFASHTFLNLNMAWDYFGHRNGTPSFQDLKNKILSYRSRRNLLEANPKIGCIVLTNPIFFEKKDWIPVPNNWAKSIVQGKSYNTNEGIGRTLWEQMEERLKQYRFYEPIIEDKNQIVFEEPEAPRYGKPVMLKPRLGQGAFRVLVASAYQNKCAISGEKTLPALEAAHIKSYSNSGPHQISNGLMLRSDIHKLFDQGYLTVTKDYKVEISQRIKEEFSNGKDYYKYHGEQLVTLPTLNYQQPASQYLDWHNNNIYSG